MITLNNKSEDKTSKLSPLESSTAGAVSGFLTRAILQPLDVLKIRFQLQVESTRKNCGGLYHGIFQSIRTIYQREGLSALWKGHISAQALTVTYVMGQFGTYTAFMHLSEYLKLQESGIAITISGGMAGLVGTLFSFPFDVARTRLIAQSIPKYSGLIDVLRKMYFNEGFLSLWKGLSPSLLMAVPSTAIQFRMYTYLSMSPAFDSIKDMNIWGYQITKSAVCGATAGVCAKVAVYPLDVLKKRMQIRGSEEMRRHFGTVVVYENIFDCVWKVTYYEGPISWFKGLKPSLIKSGAFSGLIFIFYEMFRETILTYKEKSLTKS
ncbi:UNVERIFIED_CONTAM: hypothetical protein RMT77_000061 [Armadillidium vulgare]